MSWGQQIITALVGGGLVLLGFAIATLVLGEAVMIALVVAVFIAAFAAIAAVILVSDHYRDRREAVRDARPMYTPAPAAFPAAPIPAAGAGAITGVVVYHPEPGPLELLAADAAAVKAMPLDDYLNQVARNTGYRDRPPMAALLSDDTLARCEIPAIKAEVT